MKDLLDAIGMYLAPLLIIGTILYNRHANKVKKLERDLVEKEKEVKVYENVIKQAKEAKEIKESVADSSRDDIIVMLDKDGTLRRTDKDV